MNYHTETAKDLITKIDKFSDTAFESRAIQHRKDMEAELIFLRQFNNKTYDFSSFYFYRQRDERIKDIEIAQGLYNDTSRCN